MYKEVSFLIPVSWLFMYSVVINCIISNINICQLAVPNCSNGGKVIG